MHRRDPIPRAVRTAKRRGGGGRSPSQGEATRSRLLHEAERLFARKGYGATSLREVAKVSGVRIFTVQYHFGSKPRLYEEIVRRWDLEAEKLVSRVLAEAGGRDDLIERVVYALFDFFLANRTRVALNARAALGEGVPMRRGIGGRSWVRFMNSTMKRHRLSAGALNVGLLLMTVEGILHAHVLGRHHYRHLFGRDVTDPRMAAKVKRHLTRVILALVGGESIERR